VITNAISGDFYNNFNLFFIPKDQFDNVCFNSYEDYKSYIKLGNLSYNF
jgi:hypothetical protein